MAGSLRQRLFSNSLLTGSALLFISTTVVNLGNYLFNLVLGRWLGPADFADLSLIVTLMLMVTLVTATLQTVVAKYAATYNTGGHADQLRGLWRWMSRWSWIVGIVLAASFVLGAPLLQQFFHTVSFWPFVMLGIGIPIYFAQGVDRGVLQGQLRFLGLAVSYQAEMWARLVLGLIFVMIGWSVNGAVGALTLSFLASLIALRLAGLRLSDEGELNPEQRHAVLLFAGPVAAALIGQILINNSDVLLVKRFFPAEDAGQYAALALIGRMVFFATWSVVTVLLPTVAQRHEEGKTHWNLLWISLGMVLAVSAVIIGGSFVAGDMIVGALFGPAYLDIAPLLWIYAIATTLYAAANVFIVYRLSTGNGLGSYFAVVAGIAQVVTLSLFHNTLEQVVLVQIGLMSVLLIALIIWEMFMHRQDGQRVAETAVGTATPA